MSLTREQELLRAAIGRLTERIAANAAVGSVVALRHNARSLTVSTTDDRAAALVVDYAQREGLRATRFLEGLLTIVIVR